MTQRPTSVTIVAWLLIAFAVLGGAATILTLGHPEVERMLAASPLARETQLALNFAGIIVTFACGLGILQRRTQARWLYVIWNAAMIGLNLFTAPSPIMLGVSLLLLAIVAYILFRAPADAWFRGRGSA